MEIDWWQQPAPEYGRAIWTEAEAHQQQLTKPPGSLGQLEAVAIQLAAMQGQLKPMITAPHVTIFAADHGVVKHNVSAFPQAVTVEMVRNFSRGGAAIAVLARAHQMPLTVVNVGTATEIGPLPSVHNASVSRGTRSFLEAAAMSSEQLQQALNEGRLAVERAVAAGCDLWIGGEMGIGNTTSAAAVAAALLSCSGETIAGAGTGLDQDGVAHKAAVIQQGIDLHGGQLDDPLSVLQHLGGFEIAALCGGFIAAAQQKLPVLVDGFITSVAALVAVRAQPSVRPWLLFAHRSAEQGHQKVLEALEASPLLDMGMRLGEGSGAAVALPLLQQACLLHGEMATFAEAGVSEG